MSTSRKTSKPNIVRKRGDTWGDISVDEALASSIAAIITPVSMGAIGSMEAHVLLTDALSMSHAGNASGATHLVNDRRRGAGLDHGPTSPFELLGPQGAPEPRLTFEPGPPPRTDTPDLSGGSNPGDGALDGSGRPPTPESGPQDTTGDGRSDRQRMDLDGDGHAESTFIDDDGDGLADRMELDENRDGVAERTERFQAWRERNPIQAALDVWNAESDFQQRIDNHEEWIETWREWGRGNRWRTGPDGSSYNEWHHSADSPDNPDRAAEAIARHRRAIDSVERSRTDYMEAVRDRKSASEEGRALDAAQRDLLDRRRELARGINAARATIDRIHSYGQGRPLPSA